MGHPAPVSSTESKSRKPSGSCVDVQEHVWGLCFYEVGPMEKPQVLHLTINLFGRATGCKTASTGGPQRLTVNVEQCIWMQLPFWGRIIGKLCQNVNVQRESVLLFLDALHQLSFTWYLDINVVNIIYFPCKWRAYNCDRRPLSLFGWGTTTLMTNTKIRNDPEKKHVYPGTIDSKMKYKGKQAPLAVSLIQPWNHTEITDKCRL